MKEHWVENTYYDNIGTGYRMECRCGFCTSPCERLEVAGAEMDEHFDTIKAAA